MKILVISHMFPFKNDKMNGIFVFHQVQALKKYGIDVVVVSPKPRTPFFLKFIKRKWKNYSLIPYRTKINNIDVYYPKYITYPGGLFFYSSGKRMYNALKKTINGIYKNFKFDIIHSHVALPDGFAGIRFAKKFNKPHILTIHGQDFQHTINKNSKYKNSIIDILNNSNKIVVVSEKLLKIGQNLVDKNKLYLLYNGFYNNYKFTEDEIKNLKEKYKNKIILLSVSNLIKTKGIDLTIKAFYKLNKSYKNIILIIIGDGYLKKHLKKITTNLNLNDKIFFLGKLKHRDVLKYMYICDIFVLPSWNEAFGIVYLEAMSVKKPVLACKGEGIDGIIKHKFNGLLVEPQSVDSLFYNLNELLKDPELRLKIGENAFRTVENMSWRNNAEKLLNIYKEFV